MLRSPELPPPPAWNDDDKTNTSDVTFQSCFVSLWWSHGYDDDVDDDDDGNDDDGNDDGGDDDDDDKTKTSDVTFQPCYLSIIIDDDDNNGDDKDKDRHAKSGLNGTDAN